MPWPDVSARIDALWVPRRNPHHTILGLTGSGKSYLVRNGILPLVQEDNVLILDQKGGDETLIGLGKDVRSIPTRLQRETDALFNGRRPMDRWYQLHVYEDLERAREQVARAFAMLWREGNWIVVVDELRALVDKDPDIGIGMRGFWSKMMMRGRSRGVAVINLSQEPWWAPSLFYTQQSHFWVGRVEDERAHKRIKEVGTSRVIMDVLPGIKNHQFLYTDSLEDTRYLAFTRVGR